MELTGNKPQLTAQQKKREKRKKASWQVVNCMSLSYQRS